MFLLRDQAQGRSFWPPQLQSVLLNDDSQCCSRRNQWGSVVEVLGHCPLDDARNNLLGVLARYLELAPRALEPLSLLIRMASLPPLSVCCPTIRVRIATPDWPGSQERGRLLWGTIRCSAASHVFDNKNDLKITLREKLAFKHLHMTWTISIKH
jgi:hypothetical protein